MMQDRRQPENHPAQENAVIALRSAIIALLALDATPAPIASRFLDNARNVRWSLEWQTSLLESELVPSPALSASADALSTAYEEHADRLDDGEEADEPAAIMSYAAAAR